MRCLLLMTILFCTAIHCMAQDGFIEGKPRLAYWQIRSSKKPIVIVLHGGPAAQHKYLRPEFDALSESATVIYYDQRGCGKSDTAISYVWQDHVKDLKRVVQTFGGKRKVFLAGSSWGSLLALLYAYSYSSDVQGLILSGTVEWLGNGNAYERTKYHPSKLLKQKFQAYRVVEGQSKLDTILITREYEVNSGTTQTEPIASMISAPTADHLTEIKIPILLFGGSQNVDKTSGYRYDWVDTYSQLLPSTSLHIFDHAGHDPWFNNPSLFFSLSNSFIRRTKN